MKMVLLKIRNRGFILTEILLASAIISIVLSSLVTTIGGLGDLVIDSANAFQAELLAEEEMASANLEKLREVTSHQRREGNYLLDFSSSFRNDFSRNVIIDVSWDSGIKEKHRQISTEITDWQNASQVAECDWLDVAEGNLSAVNSNPLNLSAGNMITDIAALGDLVYVSADSATASSSDLIILDVSDPMDPKIIGHINTGPGIAAISVTKGFVFAANAGSFQFQVIDVSDPAHPTLMVQAKMPGAVIFGSAGFGQSIHQFKNSIYLGLIKNNGPEFFAIDVSDPTRPYFLDSFELNGTANDIDAEENKVVVVTPGENSIYLLDVSAPQDISEISHYSLAGWQTQGVRSVERLGERIAVGRTLGGFYSPNAELLEMERDFSTTTALKMDASVDHIFGFENYLYINSSDPEKAFQIIDLGNKETKETFSLSSRGVSSACNKKGIYVVTQNPQDFFHIFSYQ